MLWEDTEFRQNFEAEFLITRNCNFKCPYCTIHRDEKYNRIDLNLLDRVIRGADSLFISGGEPTLHPQYTTLVRYYTERCTVVTHTNLSNPHKLPLIPNHRIMISWHPLYQNSFPWDWVKTNIKKIDVVTMMWWKGVKLDFLMRVYNQWKPILGDKLDISPLLPTTLTPGSDDWDNTHPFPEGEINRWNRNRYILEGDGVFQNFSAKTLLEKRMSFLGWECSIPTFQVTVDSNMTCHSCFANVMMGNAIPIPKYLETKHRSMICNSRLCFCDYSFPRQLSRGV